MLIFYRNNPDVIVLGLPRGGVILAAQIASSLNAPLDLVFAHKIGHPNNEEYAIGAISESGYVVMGQEVVDLPAEWLRKAKEQLLAQMGKRRALYLQGAKKRDFANKIVIIVDDGIATGLTLQAAIGEILSCKPKKLIVAVPLCPQSTARLIQKQCDEFICPLIDPDEAYRGAVGAYYDEFSQVSDEEVIACLQNAAMSARTRS